MNRRSGIRFLQGGGAIAAFLLFTAYSRFQFSQILDWDGYYHIKFAYLMRQRGILHDFSWATLGLWSQRFSDKDFLYHLYLVPFTFLPDLRLAIKLATLVLQCVTVGSFFTILRAQGVRWAFLWTALLCIGSQVFLFRMNLNRAVLVSLTYCLWVTHFSLGRRYFAVFVLSLVYAVSYTAFHLAPVLCALIVLARWIEGGGFDYKLPLVSLAGCLVGMFLHPNFPANFEMLYVQNFLVMVSAVEGMGILVSPAELGQLGTRDFLMSNGPIGLLYAASLYLSLSSRKEKRGETRALFLVSMAFLCLSALSMRFLEYAVPFCLWFSALAFRDNFEGERVSFSFPKVALPGFTLVLIALQGVRNVRRAWDELRDLSTVGTGQEPFARYLATHARPKDVVFTCRWFDTGPLFFYNDLQRYLIFLDPFFLEYQDSRRARAWNQIREGQAKADTYRSLRYDFRASWGFCAKDAMSVGLYQSIRKDPRLKIVMEQSDFFLFQVGDEKVPPVPLSENT